MLCKVADAPDDNDFRLHLIPIRQISRQAIGGSSQVRGRRTELFRQQNGWFREEGLRRMRRTSRAAGSSRRSSASPDRSGSHDRNSRGRLRPRQMRWRRKERPTGMPPTPPKRSGGWSRSDKTAVGEIESRSLPAGLTQAIDHRFREVEFEPVCGQHPPQPFRPRLRKMDDGTALQAGKVKMPRTGAVSSDTITARDVPRQNGYRHAPGRLQISEIAIDGAQADRITDPVGQFASRERLVRILLKESVQFFSLLCPICHNLRMVRILYHVQRIPNNSSGPRKSRCTPGGYYVYCLASAHEEHGYSTTEQTT